MGSGLGSVSNERLVGAIGALLKAVVSGGFSIEADAVPLTDVESAWTSEASARTVFTM
jgi:hypothetical protein